VKYHVVVPAAGSGKRMQAGKNKQFLLLKNKPIIVHTLEIFEQDEECKSVILVANPSEISDMKELIKSYRLQKVVQIVAGGSERQFSVHNGIKFLVADELVLVHDGARPFVTKETIKSLTDEAEKTGAAVLGVPVKDTIKKVKQNVITETVDRSSLWAIQTPQAFRLSLLKTAYEQAEHDNFIGTDDASLVERLGHQVSVVEGDYKNFKITTPEDLMFAKVIVQERGEK
jgi:2-C-methyl-D-erythritol 4-phosphate cytidylyltransferase